MNKTMLEWIREVKKAIDNEATPYISFDKLEKITRIKTHRLAQILAIMNELGYIEKYSRKAWKKIDQKQPILEQIEKAIDKRIATLKSQRKAFSKENPIRKMYTFAIEELLLLQKNLQNIIQE